MSARKDPDPRRNIHPLPFSGIQQPKQVCSPEHPCRLDCIRLTCPGIRPVCSKNADNIGESFEDGPGNWGLPPVVETVGVGTTIDEIGDKFMVARVGCKH